jgi:hypothetical protein
MSKWVSTCASFLHISKIYPNSTYWNWYELILSCTRYSTYAYLVSTILGSYSDEVSQIRRMRIRALGSRRPACLTYVNRYLRRWLLSVIYWVDYEIVIATQGFQIQVHYRALVLDKGANLRRCFRVNYSFFIVFISSRYIDRYFTVKCVMVERDWVYLLSVRSVVDWRKSKCVDNLTEMAIDV